MTWADRDKHLSLALDALLIARETFDTYAYAMPPGASRAIRHELLAVKAHIEAATTMTRPGVLRRWFGRTERRAA